MGNRKDTDNLVLREMTLMVKGCFRSAKNGNSIWKLSKELGRETIGRKRSIGRVCKGKMFCHSDEQSQKARSGNYSTPVIETVNSRIKPKSQNPNKGKNRHT